jgi:DNA-binding NtrC family response regulator
MRQPAVIVAVNDPVLRRHVHALLRARRRGVFEALDTGDILRPAQRQRPDLVLLGPLGDGAWAMLHIAQQIRRANRLVPLTPLVAHSSEALAVAALRAGITDYFKLPLAFDEFAASVTRCLSGTPSPPFSRRRDTPMPLRPMVGESPSMQQIKTYIGRLALTVSTVLVTDESGTGLDIPSARRHNHVTL